jgi:carboxylesterase type B
MVIQNEGLRPVEVFSGLQYASTRQNMLRFIPPSSSLEKWLGVRMFSSKTYRGVCPQPFRRVKQIKSKRPKQYLEHLRKVDARQ